MHRGVESNGFEFRVVQMRGLSCVRLIKGMGKGGGAELADWRCSFHIQIIFSGAGIIAFIHVCLKHDLIVVVFSSYLCDILLL